MTRASAMLALLALWLPACGHGLSVPTEKPFVDYMFGSGTAPKMQALPKFHVYLDIEPEQRWAQVAEYYKRELPLMMTAFQQAMDMRLGTMLPSWAKLDAIDGEYIRELQGIVTVVNDKRVTLQRLIHLQMLYEMGSPTFCSGILAANQSGTVFHGRNMDYSFKFKGSNGRVLNWPDVTFDVYYYRDGRQIMTSTNWPGRIGINTGMRFGGWSFTQNTRLTNNVMENLLTAQNGGMVYGLFVRKLMESVEDFETAVQSIYKANFMSSFYAVLAGTGPYEGAVLTIDRGGLHMAGSPPIQRLSSTKWNIVQTNDDLLGPSFDPRRPIAEEVFKKSYKKQVTIASISQLMHALPIYNPLTVFTWVAVPASNYHDTSLYDLNAMRNPNTGDGLGYLPILQT